MKNILIWGTGTVAKQMINNGLCCEIEGFIETNRRTEFFQGKKVYEPSSLPQVYDYIIVANTYVNEIYKLCMDYNIDLNKIIFLKHIKNQCGFSGQGIIKEILGEKNYIDYCREFNIDASSFVKEDGEKYEKLNKRERFRIQEQYMWPVITDKYALAGTIHNYFWQDLWAARLIHRSGVKKHFDIGSRVDGFISHLLAMEIQTTVIDIRKFPGEVENLFTIVDDATALIQISDESIQSMSALCSLEHFGLGRYGDPIDPEACFKCFSAIQKKIKSGGNLYISVPVGKERVEFNAHRVFYAATIIESFSSMQLKEFSCTAEGKIEYNADIHGYDDDSHHGDYRYGLFHFVKA